MANIDKLFVPPGEGRELVVTGVDTFYKTDDAVTGKSIDYFESVVPANSGPPLHVHNNSDETLRVLDGEFLFQVDGETVEAKAGAFIFIPKGVPHTYKNVGTEPSVLIGTFTPGGTFDFYNELIHATPNTEETINEITERHGHALVGPPL